MSHPLSSPLLLCLYLSLCIQISAYNYEPHSEQPLRLCDCHTTCKGPMLVYYCGTDEEDRWSNPCQEQQYESLPFCDESLQEPIRVQDIINRLSDDEKLGTNGTSTPLSNYATGLPSVGMRYVQWWNEALHGVAISPGVLFDKTAPFATSFPQIISTSHSFNRTLFAAIGAAIATEIRAFANIGHAGLTYWTPNLNIFRDPRWGRGQETPGEDPYLTSEYVAAYVPGLQHDPVRDPQFSTLKVSACCKHYAAYSLENYQGMDRHHFDAVVTEQDMADTYLPAFKACASPEQGGASCIMCSYNSINGVPSCANQPLLQRARLDWGFQGYITSDCGAVEDIYSNHEYSSSPEAAVGDSLRAGMDMECGKWLSGYLKQAVDKGEVSMDMVTEALRNLVAVLMRLGRFNKNGPFDDITMDAVNSAENQMLAADAARQSVVLLKNDPPIGSDRKTTLPLSPTGITLAVVGPNANATRTMQGNYNGPAPYIISPLEGLSREGVRTVYAKGCEVDSMNTDGIALAVEAVEESDAVVLVVGLNQSQEKEGHDRESIALPGVQQDMVEAVLSAAEVQGVPVVLVVMSGGAVCLGLYRDDPRVGAILFVGYPGQAGGQGIADVVYGDYNPSGRLTQTFYRGSFVDEVSFLDMGMRRTVNSSGAVVNPGRGYRFYEGNSVVYPFGHGLSYTSFYYSWVMGSDIKQVQYGLTDKLTVQLEVSVNNTGDMAGSEVVLVFLVPPSNTMDGAPKKTLKYFDKIYLEPEQQLSISITLTDEDFSLADTNGDVEVAHGLWTVQVGDLTSTILI